MTVTNTDSSTQFTGTGENTALTITWPFIDSGDLIVTQRVTATGAQTVLTETTHYTVTGGGLAAGGFAGGTVTPVDGATDFTSDMTWTVERLTPLTQLVDYQQGENFAAETDEAALDKLTMQSIDRSGVTSRALSFPVTDDPDLDPTIPDSVSRASKSLGFDSDGEPIALSGTVSGDVLVTDYMEGLLDDGDADTARATLVAQEDVIATQGDLIQGSAEGTPEILALGDSGEFLRSNGTNQAWSSVGILEYAWPRGHLSGLGLTRTSSTLIDAADGRAKAGNSSNPSLINGFTSNAAFGKNFVVGGWVAGDGTAGVPKGGVPTAAGFAASIATWHYFMLVGVDGSVDFGYDTSVTAVNLLADAAVKAELGDLVFYRRIGSFRSTATPNIPDFFQQGDLFMMDDAVQDINAGTPGTSTVTHTLASIPTGIRVEALVSIVWIKDAAGFHKVSHGDASSLAAASDTDKDAQSVGTTDTVVSWSGPLLTNTSAQIKTRSDIDVTSLDIQVRGWIDRRGRDD